MLILGALGPDADVQQVAAGAPGGYIAQVADGLPVDHGVLCQGNRRRVAEAVADPAHHAAGEAHDVAPAPSVCRTYPLVPLPDGNWNVVSPAIAGAFNNTLPDRLPGMSICDGNAVMSSIPV